MIVVSFFFLLVLLSFFAIFRGGDSRSLFAAKAEDIGDTLSQCSEVDAEILFIFRVIKRNLTGIEIWWPLWTDRVIKEIIDDR